MRTIVIILCICDPVVSPPACVLPVSARGRLAAASVSKVVSRTPLHAIFGISRREHTPGLSYQAGLKGRSKKNQKNKKQIYNIDLTSSDILGSDFFYLRNNDLIYVQPLKFKGFRKSQSQLLLSALTTFAVLFNVYLKFAE